MGKREIDRLADRDKQGDSLESMILSIYTIT